MRKHDDDAVEARMARARELSWARHGRRVSFYLPGMFVRDGVLGRYPAVSITGPRCRQHCAHCDGGLLRTMHHADDPDLLVETCVRLAGRGMEGVLLSGGCDGRGRLPWNAFIDAVARVKERTNLFVSAHCGMLDASVARRLKAAGVDQALVDVVGDARTYEEVCLLPDGLLLLERTLDALAEAGLPVVPHVIAGLHFGEMRGERAALELIARHPPAMLVVVALMNLPGTPMADAPSPDPRDVRDLILKAREMMPDTELSLGCARPRRHAAELERLALLSGVSRMALPSPETEDLAEELGLETRFRETCCSVHPGAGAAGCRPGCGRTA